MQNTTRYQRGPILQLPSFEMIPLRDLGSTTIFRPATPNFVGRFVERGPAAECGGSCLAGAWRELSANNSSSTSCVPSTSCREPGEKFGLASLAAVTAITLPVPSTITRQSSSSKPQTRLSNTVAAHAPQDARARQHGNEIRHLPRQRSPPWSIVMPLLISLVQMTPPSSSQ